MNLRLLLTLGIGWLGLVVAGWAISQYAPVDATTVAIDRSYCPPERWQALSLDYAALYRQHQRQTVRIDRVVLFSNLGDDPLDHLPTPTEIEQLRSFGRFSADAAREIRDRYPEAVILECG